ncbi:unnamed protein product [Bemisia tabaci]|uniref:DUF4817 domain-containing protein n=1 Tax=Bemisia tabaci TaxID=7038 RepID=A0A9P0G2B9_BEMTA|nr:unnamed protein product [Bemisia tabaci]
MSYHCFTIRISSSNFVFVKLFLIMENSTHYRLHEILDLPKMRVTELHLLTLVHNPTISSASIQHLTPIFFAVFSRFFLKIPFQYSSAEYADMVYVYGYCNGNAVQSAAEYSVRFPNRTTPSPQTFRRTFSRLRETGSLFLPTQGDGVFAPLYDVNRTATILEHFDNDPRTSTRRAAAILEILKSTVHETLRADGRHPYHLQRVQNLLPGDLPRRVEFCNWFLTKSAEHPLFPRRVFWTDEATFTMEGIFNQRNHHIWAHENPHSVREHHFRHDFRLNVWLGILDNKLFGPHFLPNRLDGPNCLDFLSNELLVYL